MWTSGNLLLLHHIFMFAVAVCWLVERGVGIVKIVLDPTYAGVRQCIACFGDIMYCGSGIISQPGSSRQFQLIPSEGANRRRPTVDGALHSFFYF